MRSKLANSSRSEDTSRNLACGAGTRRAPRAPAPGPARPTPIRNRSGGHLAQLGGVDARRQQHHARLLDQVVAERLHPVGAEVAREADAAALRVLPVEQVRPSRRRTRRRRAGSRSMIARLRALISSPRRRAAAAISSLGAGVADRRVVLARLQPLEHRAVAAGEPADAQAGQAVGLGHHAERERGRRQVGRLRERRGALRLEPAVDLVGEQPDAALLAQRDERRPGRGVGQRARRVVGEVDGDEPRLGPQQRAPARRGRAPSRSRRRARGRRPPRPSRSARSPSTGSWARSRPRARPGPTSSCSAQNIASSAPANTSTSSGATSSYVAAIAARSSSLPQVGE